jgi:hypothetical protein
MCLHWKVGLRTTSRSPPSAEKFKFARKEVEFAWLMITEVCIKPAAKYTASINDFPTCSNISKVRALYGLVNQTIHCFCKTEIMALFRP